MCWCGAEQVLIVIQIFVNSVSMHHYVFQIVESTSWCDDSVVGKGGVVEGRGCLLVMLAQLQTLCDGAKPR